jgi:hypothetical protein
VLHANLQIDCVENFIAVALFSQEPLAILREILVNGVARNQGVEVCRSTIALWAQ